MATERKQTQRTTSGDTDIPQWFKDAANANDQVHGERFGRGARGLDTVTRKVRSKN